MRPGTSAILGLALLLQAVAVPTQARAEDIAFAGWRLGTGYDTAASDSRGLDCMVEGYHKAMYFPNPTCWGKTHAAAGEAGDITLMFDEQRRLYRIYATYQRRGDRCRETADRLSQHIASQLGGPANASGGQFEQVWDHAGGVRLALAELCLIPENGLVSVELTRRRK